MKVSRFTPSLMQPEDLEAIFVQRHQLAEDIVERISDSVLTLSPHHTLLIGPRGIGKTHLVSLVYHRIRKREALQNRLLIAWLREEEWGVTSFLDLLLRIFRALQENDGDFAKIQVKGGREGLIKRVESLYELSSDEAEQAGAELLQEIIGENRLLLLMENLDDIFSGLGKKGQKQLHAFLQENPGCTILATSQSLFDEVKKEKSPFYEFFHINHLEDLTVEEAIELLANIARVRGDRELESFIRQPRGRDRIQAVHHLAGGNHRVYVIFSEFLTHESLDELVEPFMRMLDDLTPYYQARMASLSPQQRKIVEFLCDRRHAVPVKEIAQRCFLTHQTTSSQLKDLREKGYVMSDAIGRESFYEMRETLMRFCLEVKKQRGEPIQLFVDFLRIWYTKEELLQLLAMLSPDAAPLEQVYLLKALHLINKQDIFDPKVYEQIIQYFMENDNLSGALKIMEKLTIIYKKTQEWELIKLLGLGWLLLGRWNEGLTYWNKAIELYPEKTMAWINRGVALRNLGFSNEALNSFNKSIEIETNNILAWFERGVTLGILERYDEALVSYDKAIELNSNDKLGENYISVTPIDQTLHSLESQPIKKNGYNPTALLWHNRGSVLANLKRHNEALVSYDKALEIRPDYVQAWNNRGRTLAFIGEYNEALISFNKAIELNPNDATAWHNRGGVQGFIGNYTEALVSYDQMIDIGINNALAWSLKSWVLGKIGRYNEAVKYCEKCINISDDFPYTFFNRAEYLLILNHWNEGITALDDALNRFAHTSEPNTGDTEAIICSLFNSTTDSAIWRSRIKTLIELYHKHQVISTLGQGLVKSVPTLLSEMVSDKAAQTWLEVWQELASDYPEFQIPLRLLKAAVGYKETKGNKRVLFSLPIEERKLLEPLLGIADTSAVK